jgi:tetratricopeptide (TPR) repeat protein
MSRSPALRLELVAQAADALAAAHSVGVLHKDVKPANLLIDTSSEGAARAVLADFGSGGLLDPAQLEVLRITRLGLTEATRDASNRSGTTLYLAPELLEGASPTTRSDIYSLGVVLYQSVVDDFRRVLAPGWERDIGDVLLRDDIAAATDRDPARRLGSATELAQRLRTLPHRHEQAREAALARARSEADRRALDKARRRRRGWSVVSAMLALVLAVTGVFLWQSQRARDAAEVAAERNHAMVQFLTEDLLAQGDPFFGVGADARLDEVLVNAERRIDSRFEDRPEVGAPLHRSLGSAFAGMGRWEDATRAFGRALALSEAAGQGSDPEERIWALYGLGDVAVRQGRFDQANQRYAEAQDLIQTLSDAGDERWLWLDVERSWVQHELGHTPTAVVAVQAAVDRLRKSPGRDPDLYAFARHYLALMQVDLSQYEVAAALYAELETDLRRHHGDGHPSLGQLARNRAALLVHTGRATEAIAELEPALAQMRARLGDEHPETHGLMSELGFALLQGGRAPEAVALLERAAQARRAQLGLGHNRARGTLMRLAEAYRSTGRAAEATTLLEEVCRAAEAQGREPRPELLRCHHQLALALMADGTNERGAALLSQTITAARQLPAGLRLREAILASATRDAVGAEH